MGSSIQDIAYTFLQTYYERMKNDPNKLSSLYSHTAELTHINYQQLDSNKSKDDILSTIKLAGKDNIHRFFVRNAKKVSDLKLKLDSCDFQTTGIAHKGIIIMVTGELFWSNSPVFRFCQTFTLVPIGKNSDVYDITNDIIRFIPNETSNVEIPSESVIEEVKEPVKEEPIKEEQSIEKEHKEKVEAKKEDTPVVTEDKIEVVPTPVEEAPKETKKSSKHKKESSINKESKKTIEVVKSDTPTIKETHTSSTKKTEVSDVPAVEKTTTKREESDDKKKKKSEEKKEAETKPKDKKETKIETSEKLKNKHSEKHTKTSTHEPTIVTENAVETVKKVEVVPEVKKESQEQSTPEEVKDTEVRVKIETTTTVAVTTAQKPDTLSEPVFTPAPVPAAPKKMSWASKVSQHEGVPKESRKIIVHREEPSTSHNESNSKSKKNNNNNNNNRNNRDSDRRDHNNNNKQNNNKRRVNNNVNRDGYYPVYINGIQNVKPESVKNKVIQEFGPVMKMSTRDNFIVVDFQLESSQKEAIDAKKLIVDGVEVSLERKTYKKGQQSNNNNGSSNSASSSLTSDYRTDSRSPKRFNSNKKPV
ncbi:hypothetical protein C6P45_005052 [Maudiozyma exigua]|uniref:NTF2 domain-containing protein n=1 Tax=Maudiozyma exigua TaxID=34358 RepID=A0A9P6WF58_MAUEX|nr:hypothetical protein C6P45_005052 [Kazachstania exigua]